MSRQNPIIREGKRILNAYLSQPISIYGAAVAYYTVFSLAPILIITIAVLGFFFDSGSARDTVLTQFTATFGSEGSDFLRTLIDSQSNTNTGVIATIAGLVFVILGATGIFNALETALNSIFSSLPEKHAKGFASTLWEKVASLGMVLSIGFVLLVSLAISATLNVFGEQIDTYIPDGSVFIGFIGLVITFLLVSLFLGMLIKFLPSKRLPWRPALYGGLIAGAGFVLGKYLLGLYFTYSAAASAYGAASAVILIILWAYYLSQVFFFAAILTQLYFLPRHHSRKK